jgi:hypothetical protein
MQVKIEILSDGAWYELTSSTSAGVRFNPPPPRGLVKIYWNAIQYIDS